MAYAASLFGLGVIWLAKLAADPGSDSGVGALAALVSADVFVVLGAINPSCFDLGLIHITFGVDHRTVAFVLATATIFSAVVPLTCQREAKLAVGRGDVMTYIRFTAFSVVATSTLSWLHLVWITRQINKWELFQ
ncbi:MAG TPA: hypothetical protein PK264_12935 [Hyphomicrobiaceae bacterium]|nr:hypothetical protein [Hyphomicrobiaceae bacterium]